MPLPPYKKGIATHPIVVYIPFSFLDYHHFVTDFYRVSTKKHLIFGGTFNNQNQRKYRENQHDQVKYEYADLTIYIVLD